MSISGGLGALASPSTLNLPYHKHYQPLPAIAMLVMYNLRLPSAKFTARGPSL